jgi:aspartate/methionine/tyrosine aminotransferase
MQRAALTALQHGGEFLARARAEYAAARDATVARLPVPCGVPEGGSYVFLDLERYLAPGEQAVDLLERLAAEGILLAPGDAFGKAFACWARLCYTAVPRERLLAGLDKLAAILTRG